MGIVNLQESNAGIRELTVTRAVESLPFAGRYRLLDFALSSLVNSGINSVGVTLPDYSRSVLDHIRSGKDWDLARRRDGLTWLPAALPDNDSRKGDLKDLYANLDFAELNDRKYVILTGGAFVYNIDFREVFKFMEDTEADITMVYHTAKRDRLARNVIVQTSTNGIVTDLAEASSVKVGDKFGMGIYLMPIPTFAYIVRSTYERGGQDFTIDGIIRHAAEHKISAYEHKGYIAHVNSVAEYYKANRDMLKHEIWEEIFMKKDRPIFTKVKDEVPVQYKSTANVKNSLIANGCIIRGTVENSIIFRGVTIGKDAVVKDSIIMQCADVGEGARVENVIADKNVIISKNRWLKGAENYPYIVGKNVRI